MSAQGNIVTHVRALYTFKSTEFGELGFEKGDIIKVVDRRYKDWWRGQLKGRTGVFPVNYVVRIGF
jgi:signal transducing adaptor molecule